MCINKIFNFFRRGRRSLPPTDKSLGIDISHWQGKFDFAKAKSKGVKFVIHKICDVNNSGTAMFYDMKAEEYYISAKENGFAVGGYAWLNPFFDVTKQAQFYINWYKSHDMDFPPVLDFEDTHFVNGNDYISKAQQWLSIVEKATGRTPIIYTAEWFMSRLNRKNTQWMGQYPLWVAHYTSRSYPTLPKEWSDYKIWQYTDKGTYPYHQSISVGKGKEWGAGSDGLDMDWFNGTFDELLAYCDTEVISPPVPEPPSPVPQVLFKAECVTGALTVREGSGINYKATGRYLKKGDIVDVFEVTNNWFRIAEKQWVSGYPTYMKKITEPLPPEPEPEPPVVEKYYGPLYWQRDPRWKDKPLGTSGTIGAYGCVMTAETNVLNQLGIVTNPVANNAWRTAHGGYHNGNLIVWEKVSEQHPNIIWEGKTWNPTDAQIKQKIDSGCPVIMLVDHNEGTPALNEHWVNSIPSPVDDNEIWIHDPWDNVTIKLRDRYKKPIGQFSSYHKKV